MRACSCFAVLRSVRDGVGERRPHIHGAAIIEGRLGRLQAVLV